MKGFYVVFGDGRLWRRLLWRLVVALMIKRSYATLDAARGVARRRCRRWGGRVYVLKSMGFAHVPPRRVAWRKTKGNK